MTEENPQAAAHPQIPDAMPVLPLLDTVVMPFAVAPLIVGQESSIRLVDDVMRGNRLLALVGRRQPQDQAPQPADLYEVGTAALIHRLIRGQDGPLHLVVQGLERVQILEYTQTQPYFVARILQRREPEFEGVESEALKRTVIDLFRRLVGLVPEVPKEVTNIFESVTQARQLSYLIASTAPLDMHARQEILEMDAVSDKLRRLIELLQQELAVRELQREIVAETQEQISKSRRDHLLREQIKTLQRQLGEDDGQNIEMEKLRTSLDEANLPEEARREADRELGRMERMTSASPEHGMIRSYLEWLASLPWNKLSGQAIDVARAHQVLDEDHYDLERIKDRILEYLAVKKLREERREKLDRPAAASDEAAASTVVASVRHEPILCFVGPPGVGKTSLGQSIARAMGRKFIRMSLGGVHDEAEIRGHRRTYIGAFPGRIIQAMRRAEAADPVFMLDEIDKLGTGFQGDPAAALLEVLDPAQNHSFVDTYLGLPFNLSRVLFICTANTTDTIPAPLLDRMEVLSLTGYTESEKLHIARRYLLPNQLEAHGLNPGEVTMDDEALRRIILAYTREAGVRNLEREIASVVRKAARHISEGSPTPIHVSADELADYLRRPRYINEVIERIDRPGVATGLAWTPAGGDVLFIEATMMKGQKEQLILTGMLGDVMRESAQTALSYLRSNLEQMDFDPDVFAGKIVHLHVPAGAIPKDGPSAGVTMLTALASLASGQIVRKDVAMTGEITLRGKVLPVGGIREKVLAAYRAGVKTVILPQRNKDDLEEVASEVKDQLEFIFADSADQVLAAALPLARDAWVRGQPKQEEWHPPAAGPSDGMGIVPPTF